ncbi:tyrosinase family protein [Gilvibacter sp.]|uniref:tyrosinase family protein n=1 Tax=Gilvibacter sp. TaxID=2729997 RepID=UPI003F49E504
MNPSKTSSRRAFLQKAGLTTLGLGALPVLSASFSSCENNASNKTISEVSSGTTSLVTRKNIADFAVDDAEIKLLQDAIKILKDRSERSPLDPMGWTAHGMLHATFCATSIYSNQVHYNWYVWPWHRLYLWSMEQKLQKAVNEPKLALHYWDWTQIELHSGTLLG